MGRFAFPACNILDLETILPIKRSLNQENIDKEKLVEFVLGIKNQDGDEYQSNEIFNNESNFMSYYPGVYKTNGNAYFSKYEKNIDGIRFSILTSDNLLFKAINAMENVDNPLKMISVDDGRDLEDNVQNRSCIYYGSLTELVKFWMMPVNDPTQSIRNIVTHNNGFALSNQYIQDNSSFEKLLYQSGKDLMKFYFIINNDDKWMVMKKFTDKRMESMNISNEKQSKMAAANKIDQDKLGQLKKLHYDADT